MRQPGCGRREQQRRLEEDRHLGEAEMAVSQDWQILRVESLPSVPQGVLWFRVLHLAEEEGVALQQWFPHLPRVELRLLLRRDLLHLGPRIRGARSWERLHPFQRGVHAPCVGQVGCLPWEPECLLLNVFAWRADLTRVL